MGRLLIRKGEEPKADWSNLWQWSEREAQKTDKFEEFFGTPPPIPRPVFHTEPLEVKLPSEDVKVLLVAETIKKMDGSMFTDGGYPKLSELRKILGFDIDKELRDKAFALVQSQSEE